MAGAILLGDAKPQPYPLIVLKSQVLRRVDPRDIDLLDLGP